MNIMSNAFFKKIVSTFASRGFSAGGTFFLSFSLGHILGVHGTGIFMIGLSIMMGLKVVGCFGMENAILKYGGNSWGDKDYVALKNYISISFGYGVVLSSIIGVVFFICSSHIARLFSSYDEVYNVFILVSLIYPFLVLSSLICAWMRACELPELSSFFEIGSISMFTAVGMWIAKIAGFENSSYMAMSILLTVVILEVVVGYFILLSFKIPPKIKFSKKNEFSRSLLDYFVIDSIFYLTQWGGVVLLGLFVSSASVGIFTLAHRLAFTVNFVLTVFDSIVAPRFSYFFSTRRLDDLKKLALDTTKYMSFFSLPILLLMMFFPSSMLNLLGSGAEDGIYILMILALAQFVNVSTGPVVFILSMTGHQKILKKILLLSSIIGIVCYFLMVPIWKGNGAAFAIFVTMSLQNLIATFVVKKKFGFNTILWWRG